MVKVDKLTANLAKTQSCLPKSKSQDFPSLSHDVTRDTSDASVPSQDNRKFNTVLFGIPEPPPRTPPGRRVSDDCQSVASLVDPGASIRDCFRLGKSEDG